MSSTHNEIAISLPEDDALIFFDWLARFNEGNLTTPDDIEKQVLCNIEATLEKLLVEPFAKNYDEIIDSAKSRIRDSL